MINSLRFRITAWYLAFFALLFTAFGIFLYGVLAASLERRLDEALVSYAATAAGIFQDEVIELAGDVDKAAAQAISEIKQQGATIAIFDGEQPIGSTLPPPAGLGATLRGIHSARVIAIPHAGANGYRAAVHPAPSLGINYLAVAVAPLDSVVDNLKLVRQVLLFALPMLLAIAGLGGYLLTTRGLAPLQSMASQAHGISGTNLGKRIDIGNAAGELMVLSASFNDLLGRLDQSFETMRRFVADASHELRTPMAVIQGEADVALSQQRSAGEYRESLAVILEESRRLSRLIGDLLNLARADAGSVTLRVEEIYLNDLLADCCRSLEPLADTRGVRLGCLPADDAPFRGDEQLLRRLILNLLDNAIRYTPRGGEVSASLETGPAGVRLRIADTGIGVAPDAVSRIFERFYRTDLARSREDGGFGLGLSIVKWIAESHRGAVEVESRPAAGSIFTVSLPR
jgi:heavy metal sensor kinase